MPAGRPTACRPRNPEAGRVGRLLRLALAVLLGAETVSGVHPGRDADPVGLG
jgi:hypothetical protein